MASVNAHRLVADLASAVRCHARLRVRVLTDSGRVLVVHGEVAELGLDYAVLTDRDGRRHVVRLDAVLPPLERPDGRVFSPKSNDHLDARSELRTAEHEHEDAGGLEP